ncbi:MAG: hypothetical protein ABJD68_05530, partial [Nakamurella sp.]
WTMDGSVTSQFEQHLRAVLDYPLGRTDQIAPFVVMGNVLGGASDPTRKDDAPVMGMDERVHHLAARFPEVKVHLYGKAFRPGRKLGHVNVIGSDLGELRRRAQLAARWLGDGLWPDGYDIHGAGGAGRNERPTLTAGIAATPPVESDTAGISAAGADSAGEEFIAADDAIRGTG